MSPEPQRGPLVPGQKLSISASPPRGEASIPRTSAPVSTGGLLPHWDAQENELLSSRRVCPGTTQGSGALKENPLVLSHHCRGLMYSRPKVITLDAAAIRPSSRSGASMLRPRKQTSGSSCEWDGWRRGSMRLLYLSCQTSPQTWSEAWPVWVWVSWTSVTWLSSSDDADLKWDAVLHPSLEIWSTGCRTRTLSHEEGLPQWPPSSTECSLLVPLPEPARGRQESEWPRWIVVAEHRIEYDSLFLPCAGHNETHLAVDSTLLNSLVRESVSRDWPLV